MRALKPAPGLHFRFDGWLGQVGRYIPNPEVLHHVNTLGESDLTDKEFIDGCLEIPVE